MGAVTGWRAKLCYLLRSRLVTLHPAKREKKKVDFGRSGRVGTKNDGVAGKQNKRDDVRKKAGICCERSEYLREEERMKGGKRQGTEAWAWQTLSGSA